MSHRLRMKPIHIPIFLRVILFIIMLMVAYLLGTQNGVYVGRAEIQAEILYLMESEKNGSVGAFLLSRTYKNKSKYIIEPKKNIFEGFDKEEHKR